MFNKKLVSVSTLAVALLLFSMVAAGPTLAAKGGGGKHSGGTTTTAATVTVTPNPVATYSQIEITGCGYSTDHGVKFIMYQPGGEAIFDGLVGSDGCLADVGYSNAAGSYTLEVWQNNVFMASTSFTVQ